MTSGISCSILYPCLVRQRICLRQSTELFEDAHTFSTCRGTLGDDFWTVFVFSAVLGSTSDTCSASVYGAFFEEAHTFLRAVDSGHRIRRIRAVRQSTVAWDFHGVSP